MTALNNRAARAAPVHPPLPPFAALAVSLPTEPVPVLDRREEQLLSDAMVPARRQAFARGRGAAHAALQALDLDNGPILTGPDREPLWPHGVVGAISHAADFGVALVADASSTDGVGVDLEEQRNVPELWDHVPRPEERRWLENLEPGAREKALLALFSAKESIFKAFFPRTKAHFGFEAASLSPTAAGFVGRLIDGIDGAYPSERSFDISCDWSGALVLTALVLPKTSAEQEKSATSGGSVNEMLARG